MEQTPDGLEDMVKEIQSSNRFILKRLNKVVLSSGCGDVHCTCKGEVGKCMDELGKIGDKLDHVAKAVKVFEDKMKTVEQRLDAFETSLMAVQTDDSKLRRSVRKEQENLSMVHPGDPKNETNSNTTPMNNTEDAKPLNIAKSGKSKSEDDKQNLEAQAVGSVEENETAVGDLDVKSEKSELIREMNEKNRQEFNSTKTKMDVEVLEQTRVQGHDDEDYWRYLAHVEKKQGKQTLRDLEGVHTVVCLDISASMSKGSAWTEAKTFVMDYLNGLEEVSTRYGLSDEHVALVTFGHKTKVQRRLTNKYNELRDITERLKLGGPSPLYGGLCLALAAAGSSKHQFQRINYIHVFTKTIIITDGILSDQRLYAGPDNPPSDADKAKGKVMQAIEEHRSSHLDMYFVPVGQADSEFFGLMSAVGEGTVLDFKDGRQMSRRTYLTSKIEDPLGLLSSVHEDSDWSEEDKKTMKNIRERGMAIHVRRRTSQKDMYKEIKTGDFPPVGSRVRRGPDWKWKEQDSHGPGTVIGHQEDDQVWVEWDADEHQNVYRYGRPGYDVLIVDEPRVLKKGQEIAVGCVVKPDFATGRDLHDLRQTDKGVVIKLDRSEKKATIRWNNGKRTDYSYGNPNKQEIIVCSGFQPFESEGYVLGSSLTPTPTTHVEEQQNTSKNKNKNKQSNFSLQE